MPLITLEDKLLLPEAINGDGILVGWSLELEHKRNPIGFSFGQKQDITLPDIGIDPILMEHEGHLMTIAPTGAGKGTACIVPALLRFDGPAIVIDPKGENALITARRRREMGQEVAVLDPMGITGLASAGLNPLDILNPEAPTFVDDAMSLVASLSQKSIASKVSDGDYWQERASSFVLGVVIHVMTDLPPDQRHLEIVRQRVNQAVSELALYNRVAENPEKAELAGTVLSALETSRHPEARQIGQMLRIGAITTMGGILSVAQSMVDIVRSGAIATAVRQTTFDLSAIIRGDPLSLYIVLPPHMLDSHGRLLRMWVHTLMTLISMRNARPSKSTLFILDEAAQLGTFDNLRRAVTLMRGYGLQTWSFWQDPSQLRNLYPEDWQTMVNNCRSVQCFGANTMLAARAMADMVGYPSPEQVLELEDNEMLLQLSGDMPVLARLPDYRNDPAFVGQFDANPFHDNNRPIMRNAEVGRLYARPERVATPKATQETQENIVQRLRSLKKG